MLSVFALFALFCAGSRASAQNFSIDFVGGSGAVTPSPMDPSEVAGVAPLANWNNAIGNTANGTPMALVDSNGATTAATVDWEGSPNTWSSSVPDNPGNQRMMSGYLDTNNTSTTTVTVTGLTATKTYTVYVYANGDTAGRAGKYTIGSQTFYLNTNTFDGSTFIQATSTDPANPSTGNYMAFNVAGQTSFNLLATPDPTPTMGGGTLRAPINAVQVIELSGAPAPPTNLTAAGIDGKVALNWTNSVGAASYTVKRSLTHNGPYTTIATGVLAAPYTDTTVTNGVTYFYVVTATNAIGTSGNSNEASATPVAAVTGNGNGLAGNFYLPDTVDFSAQTGDPVAYALAPTVNYTGNGSASTLGSVPLPSSVLAATNTNGVNFTAVWTGELLAPYSGPYTFETIADDGIQFSIDLKDGNGLTPIIVDPVYQGATPAFSTIVTLTAGTRYPIKLEFFQGGGGYAAQLLYSPRNSGFVIIPQSQLFTVFTAAPGPITDLIATGRPNSVILLWTEPADSGSFTIKRSLTHNGPYTTVATGVTSNTYTDTGLTNGTKYFYVVDAVNNAGASADSNEASAIPVAAATGNGDGLYGTYYPGGALDFSAESNAPILFRIDPTINYNGGGNTTGYGAGPWPAGVPATNFTAVWTGQLLAPFTGSYRLQTITDDGSRLSIDLKDGNGLQPLFDDETGHGPLANTGAPVTLTAGVKYDIKFEMSQGGGGYTAQLLYSIDGADFVIIPQTQLFSNLTQKPDAPTNLAAVAHNKSVTLYWTGGAFSLSYNIYRGTAPNGENATPIATGVTGSTFTDTGLTNGMTYFYKVAGVNPVGVGSFSNEASATPSAAISAVAYWRFEEGTAGNTVPVDPFKIPDSSNHNNTLSTPDAGTAPTYSASNPGATTNPPAANHLSIDVSADPINGFGQRFADTTNATGDINSHVFNTITIEASFNLANVNGSQTIVGKDSPGYGADPDSDLYFQLAGGVLSVRMYQSDATFVICNGTTAIVAGQWYNGAAVADGHTLSLYLQSTPGGAYHLENSVPFNGAPTFSAGGPFSVGRGYYNSTPGDRVFGLIDEVRISDNALDPSLFLFAAAAGNSVSGKIALEGVNDLTATSPGAPLGTFHVSFRTPNTTTEVFGADVTLTPVGAGNQFGTFTVSGVPAGTYDVAIKGSKNLRVSIPNVVVSGATTLPDQTLPAGDADNNNIVDIGDFGVLVNSYLGDFNVSGSGYDPAADFNFDGKDDIGDFGLLVNEFGTAGAP